MQYRDSIMNFLEIHILEFKTVQKDNYSFHNII